MGGLQTRPMGDGGGWTCAGPSAPATRPSKQQRVAERVRFQRIQPGPAPRLVATGPPVGGEERLDFGRNGEGRAGEFRLNDAVAPERARIFAEPAVRVDVPVVEGIDLDVARDREGAPLAV